MDEPDKALDLIFNVEQNNVKVFLDIYKQLEYKAYINITLAGGFLAITINGLMAILNVLNKSNSNYSNYRIEIVITAIFIIILILNIFSIFYSYLSLSEFSVKSFLYDNYINSNNINNFLSLKSDLLKQMKEKEKGLVDTFNKKTKYLNWSTRLLLFEFGGLLGGAVVFFILWYILR